MGKSTPQVQGVQTQLRDSARFGCILGEIGAWTLAGKKLWNGPDAPEALIHKQPWSQFYKESLN